MAYKLPELGYEYSALEPHIDAKTMEIHHSKHHATYVNNLNKVLESSGFQAPECPCKLMTQLSSLPESIRTVVRNNGGGHVNHSFFWPLLIAEGQQKLQGASLEAINRAFGSLDAFKEAFTAAATSRFGSGWAWLCVKKPANELFICSTANQDNPWMIGIVDSIGEPVLGLDVWEHAYYLKHQNRRPEYITAFWNALNWGQVEENYQKALTSTLLLG